MRTYSFLRFSTVFYLGAIIFAVSATHSCSKADRKTQFTAEPTIIAEFNSLRNYISSIPGDKLNHGISNSLNKKLDAAEKSYSKGKPCAAANTVGAYLNHTNALIKGKNTSIAEDLRNRGMMLQNNMLLSLPAGEVCDGYEDVGQVPEIDIAYSDNQQLSASVSFGQPVFSTVEADDETWTELRIPELQSLIGEPGMPAIPTWHQLIAVPRGATVTVKNDIPVIRSEVPANLYPFQDQTSDAIKLKYINPPFAKNDAFYETDKFYPAKPCSIKLVGNFRDLNIAQLTCTSGQYNPKTKLLRIYEVLEFEVDFDGGDGTFVTSRYTTPFEPTNKATTSGLLNNAVIGDYVLPVDVSGLNPNGEELLILTHPDFRDAADDLAQWKRDKGIITSVFEVGEGTTYDTGDAINDLIEHRYENYAVRPSYVLLMGDVEFIPTAGTHDTSKSCGPCGDINNHSDYLYSLYPHFFLDIFPDFAVGRISADTADEAQIVVDKIIKYESDPPFVDWHSGAPFYTTASNAAEFQGYLMNDDGSPRGGLDGRAQRSFTEASEFVRDEMIANGYTVERIYRSTEEAGYTGDSTPDRYRDGTLLPEDLRAGSGFAWDGDTNDIIDAFNEGRFLFLHRDHGARWGWGTPTFSTGNFNLLDNGDLLPIVYSVNCASGYFDWETVTGIDAESFMELLLREEDGGMVGGLGDNRNSPTWANSALTRGFYDATWPTTVPDFGDNTSIIRLGDILNHGKMYLLTQIGVEQTAGEVTIHAALGELIMWHTYGDPTLEMWTENPYTMMLGMDHWATLEETHIKVKYAVNGAVITAFQTTKDGTIPVGRSVVKDNIATIPYFQVPHEGVPIKFSASLKNSVSVLLTPQSLPDLVIEQLADIPFAVSPGDNITDFLTVKVGNSGGSIALGTINTDGTTKDGYMINLILSEDLSIPEELAMVPGTAGITYTEDALLKGGRISRTPDVMAASSIVLSNDPPINSDIGGIIPTETPEGSYYLCGRIDPGNKVEELNEDNNVKCMSINVKTNKGTH